MTRIQNIFTCSARGNILSNSSNRNNENTGFNIELTTNFQSLAFENSNANMSLTEKYNKALQQPDMKADIAQQQAVTKLEALSLALTENNKNLFTQVLKKLSPLTQHQNNPIQGLYLWGGVGRGKTWLMNLFYDELAIKEKYRVHFHHFMLEIHEKLSALNTGNNKGQNNDKKNPLQHIAKQLAKKYKVLCIDEFIVTNITDAMILSELMHALFKQQVCLVATSNRIPDDLYLNGLQRERFLPAIKLIKTHTEAFHLDGGVDHRTSLLEQNEVYYSPITDNTNQQLATRVQELAVTPVIENKILNILNRDIQTILCSEEIVWFDFEAICNAPRAAQDYIELVQQFNTVFVSNIPVLDEYSDDKARRFIYLIDELYDRSVKLIASAAAEPEKLYRGNMLEFAFHRTSSRLIEMRSHHYLTQQHKPF
ncbi:ATPase, AFG1 family [hydrothermal vent metagenome]|uniref:ATPase, AFG1 family n=1 Tax=hydrothermal vent metagenome TaxID=652676 RepID=A0A3B0WN30_9ZZZZ